MSTQLTKAMEDLLRFFAFQGRIASEEGKFSELSPAPITPSGGLFALVGGLFGGGSDSGETEEDNPAQTGKIRDLVIDMTEGGRFISDFAVDPELIDANDTSNFVRICYEELANFNAAKTPLMMDDTGTVVSAKSVVAPVIKRTAEGESTAQTFESEGGEPPIETGNGYSQLIDPVINVVPGLPDRYTAPSLGAIVMDKINCSLAKRNTDAVALFCAGIPTIEMSRCAPYIDMRFILGEPAVSPDNGSINTMSLLRFLGVYQVNQKKDSINYGIASAMPTDMSDPNAGVAPLPQLGGGADTDTDANLNTSNAGMELFTSPQTLVNPNINSSFAAQGEAALDARRGANMPAVLDVFQPLMTLKEIRINEVFPRGKPAGKSVTQGTITIMLHDRSRMVDISPLLDISQFSETKIFLEMGWSHPQGNIITDAPNPYATFLNSLRTRRIYNLLSGEYNLQPDGQVEITLDIMDAGSTAAGAIPIATGRYVSLSLVKSVINSAVSTALLKLQNAPQIQSPFPKEVAETGGIKSADQMVPRQVLIDCLSVLKTQSVDVQGAVDTIVETITTLIGEDGNTGEATTSEIASQATVLGEKIEGLDPMAATPDPFLCDIINVGLASYPKWRTLTPIFNPEDVIEISDVKEEGVPGAPFVSLGKVAMSMIGAPIAASQRFDEVQLIFYPFNARAGALWTTNVASFPISVLDIKESLKGLVQGGGTPRVSSVFNILKSYVDSEISPAYGFSDLYQTDKEAEGESFVISSKISSRLQELKCPFSKFAVPSLCMRIEAVPVLEPSPSNPSIRNPRVNKQICRIHIFDGATTPYAGSQYVLSLMSKDFPENILSSGLTKLFVDSEAFKDLSQNQDTGSLTSLLNTLSDETMLSKLESADGITDEDVYRVITSFDNIKKNIMKYVPSIIVGTAFSPIDSVTMRGELPAKGQEVRLEQVRQEKEKNPQAPSSGPMIGELQMIHAAVDIQSLGCPLFTVGQQYFIDMGTGTMADNLYQLVRLTHVIGEDGFKSNLTFRQSSNYTAESTRSILKSMMKSLKAAKAEG